MFFLLGQKVSKPEFGSNEQKTELQKRWFSTYWTPRQDVMNKWVVQLHTAHAQVPASFMRGKLLEGFCFALNFYQSQELRSNFNLAFKEKKKKG